MVDLGKVSAEDLVDIVQDLNDKIPDNGEADKARRHEEKIQGERTKQSQAESEVARYKLAERLIEAGRIDEAIRLVQPRSPRSPYRTRSTRQIMPNPPAPDSDVDTANERVTDVDDENAPI